MTGKGSGMVDNINLPAILGALSKPVTALVNNISKGIGNLATAALMTREAKAGSKSLTVINDAMRKIGLEPSRGGVDIKDRAHIRLHYQEIQRQENIEAITRGAIELLNDEIEEEYKEEIESDWMARFFNLSQDVSNKDMQKVWAKVLANETLEPNTFSYRALITLSTMGRDDAEKFQRICHVAYQYEEMVGVLIPYRQTISAKDAELRKRFRSIFVGGTSDLLLMETFGLIFPDSLLSNLRVPEKEQRAYVTISGKHFEFVRTLESADEEIDLGSHYRFTPLGIELMSLIEPVPNQEYLQILREGFLEHKADLRMQEIAQK